MTETLYIESAEGILERYNRIVTIITALENRMLDTAGDTANIDEYQIDDGQMKIRTIYRSYESQQRAIELLEKMRIKLLNQLNGRGSVLRPHQGLR